MILVFHREEHTWKTIVDHEKTLGCFVRPTSLTCELMDKHSVVCQSDDKITVVSSVWPSFGLSICLSWLSICEASATRLVRKTCEILVWVHKKHLSLQDVYCVMVVLLFIKINHSICHLLSFVFFNGCTRLYRSHIEPKSCSLQVYAKLALISICPKFYR